MTDICFKSICFNKISYFAQEKNCLGCASSSLKLKSIGLLKKISPRKRLGNWHFLQFVLIVKCRWKSYVNNNSSTILLSPRVTIKIACIVFTYLDQNMVPNYSESPNEIHASARYKSGKRVTNVGNENADFVGRNQIQRTFFKPQLATKVPSFQ